MAASSTPRNLCLRISSCVLVCAPLMLLTCGASPPGLPVLGDGTHSLDAVSFTVIGDANDGLDVPTDLAFDPDDPSELWVMNQAPELAPAWTGAGAPPRNAPAQEDWPSVTVYFGLDFSLAEDGHSTRHIVDPWGVHHMANVTSMAWGAYHKPFPDAPTIAGEPGDARSFGTCHESRNEFKGYRAGNDFMGPNLWSGQLGAEPNPDYDFFGQSFPDVVEAAQENCLAGCDEDDSACEQACALRDPGSHLDMLHESPNCMGIAWERDNVYWVMDGCGGVQYADGATQPCKERGDIVRYDFSHDHGPGQHDHSDGIIDRVATGVVEYVPGVPSHMKFDHAARELFVVDSGQNRVLILDVDSGEPSEELSSRESGVLHLGWSGAKLETFIDGASSGMQLPSGLAFYGDDHVLVTDNAQGKIFAFNRAGELVDELDLGLGEGALMGIDVAADGSIVGVDAVRNQIWRLAAKP